ncbi:MAG: hypothetical protein GX448_07955 [Planctomycetes bacterium]|nr:hypothetical protein [Planctomycetota bacterium]
MTRQIAETIRRFAIPDDWATWLFVELDRIEAAEADASKGQQRRLREKLAGYDGRLNRLLLAHLDQAVTVEKYRQAKNTLLQDRRKVQETLEEITLRHSSWLEPYSPVPSSLFRTAWGVATAFAGRFCGFAFGSGGRKKTGDFAP